MMGRRVCGCPGGSGGAAAVGVADLGLGGVAGQSQDGVEIGWLGPHGRVESVVVVGPAAGRPGPQREGAVPSGPRDGCAGGAGVAVGGQTPKVGNMRAGRAVTSSRVNQE